MVKEINGELLSSTLRHLGEDVVRAKRRSMQLQRENQELRGTLEALRRSVPERDGSVSLGGPGPGHGDTSHAA
jgi:hypothetical protein